MMTFDVIRIPRQGFTSADPTSDVPAEALILGSKNLMYRGHSELESIGGFKRTLYGGVGNVGGDVSMIVGKGWAAIGDTVDEGAGNIVEGVGRSVWFTGVGDITLFAPGITAAPQALGNNPLQNNIPQVCVLNEARNGYTTPFQVGLLKQLEAPVLLVASTGILNKLNGSYSVQLTWFRDATGAESLPSPPSNVTQFNNQTGIIQFPLPTNSVNPRDRWRVFGTAAGFGTVGGYFFHSEVPERRVSTESGAGYAVEDAGGSNFNIFRRNPTVTGFFSTEEVGKRLIFRNNVGTILHTATVTSVTTNLFTVKGVTYGDKITFSPAYSGTLTNTDHAWSIDSFITALRQINIEWFDNELGAEQPPTDFFPPATTASFIAGLGSHMVLIGTNDGNGIAVSVSNFPEAYPPQFRSNLSEPPVGVLSRPQDGFLYVLGENSVTVLSRTNSDVNPILPDVISDQVGAANQRAACMAGNAIYLFTKSRTPAKIEPNGLIDLTFGNRVEAIMKTWDETKVSVQFDERKGYVAYIYDTTMLLYYPGYDVWSTPIDISDIEDSGKVQGSIKSAFTLKGIIHVSAFVSTRNETVSGSPGITVTGDSGHFTSADINRTIKIPGAGPAGASYTGIILTVNGGGDVITVSPATSTAFVSVTAVVGGFGMYTFDRDTSNVDLEFDSNWKARFSFSDYDLKLAPKTVTKAVVGMKSEAVTHTLRFYRNFKTDAQMGVDRTFVSLAGNHINNIVDCNEGEGELISAELSGFESRAKIFFIQLMGIGSGIQTNYGL